MADTAHLVPEAGFLPVNAKQPIDQASYNNEIPGGAAEGLTLTITPPMSQRGLLRVMTLGFTLVVLLVLGAAVLGYRGSVEIREEAQEMVRNHLLESKATQLENLIEKQSAELLDELVYILGACLVLAGLCSTLTILFVRRTLKRLEWQTQELNRVSWHMLEGQEVVARRFSHEMHDELGQTLTGLKGMVKRLDSGEFTVRRGEMVELLDEVLRGVRELSQLLRPVILDDLGLDAGLRWLVDRFSQRTQIQVAYESNLTRRLPEQVETQLFRITQEALTNIARHSHATSAKIRLDVTEDDISLSIEDNGKGLVNPTKIQGPSLGMVGMRARARHINGELDFKSGAGGVGLRIEVTAPLKEVEANAKQEDSSLVS